LRIFQHEHKKCAQKNQRSVEGVKNLCSPDFPRRCADLECAFAKHLDRVGHRPQVTAKQDFFYTLYTSLIFLAHFLCSCWENSAKYDSAFGRKYLTDFFCRQVLIFVLILMNRKDLMGDQVNSKGFNWVAWISTIAMIGLTWLWRTRRSRFVCASAS